VHPAVEENDDQRDDTDPLDGAHFGDYDRDRGCRKQKERRRRERKPFAELAGDEREQDASGNDEHNRPELG
jgi:hypothetical protein